MEHMGITFRLDPRDHCVFFMQQIQHQTLDFTIILQVTKHDYGPWIGGLASTDPVHMDDGAGWSFPGHLTLLDLVNVKEEKRSK